MKFYGREEQLRKLDEEMKADEMRVVLILGRRRVGKSELVKQALSRTKEKSIYYECKQVAQASNTESLCQVVAEHWNLPKLGYTKMEELLDYLFQMSIKEKMVLVLDEYPYLRESIEGMDSILQSLIDKYRECANLTVVILGSYVDIMRSLLEHSNPLFGRVDLIIDLKQMNYRESALFYPAFSPEDKIRMYSVFGGIPYFNKLVDDSKSVRENIIDLIASPGARLENEVSMYLNAEISKIMNANEVFEALARGFSRYSDILSQSHVSSGPTMVDVLDKLIRMEVVAKVAPINERNNKKKAGYYICDNLSMFYYRYIFRYLSQLNLMDSNTFYSKYIEQDFEEQYVPRRFEEVCKQYLIDENKKGKINPVFEKIGKYYYDDPINHTNGEFDIVTEDEKGYVFYEVKFRKSSLTDKMIEKEIQQVEKTTLNCYQYVFFTREKFQGQVSDQVKYINLEQLFGE